MTGIIKSYDPAAKSGWIEAETGENIFFEAGSVVAFDQPAIGVHRAVSFELRHSRGPAAANISLSYQHYRRTSTAAGRPDEIVFRYVGFHQDRALRVFRFERICPGQETQTHNVSTDMALFAKHRLAIQEAPSLCSQLLLKPAEVDRSEHALTEADLVAHAASRVAPLKKQIQRRKVPPNPLPAWNTITK
jgi:cold shock CspA family protein